MQLLVWYSQDFTVRYIDSSNELPFDQTTLVRHLERVIVASSPWQTTFMRIRNIYRWEDPKRTLSYLLLYMLLIQINFVVTAGVSLRGLPGSFA